MSRTAIIPVLAAALCGCYAGRLTGNFSDLPELGCGDDSAVLEESGMDEASEAERERRLRELAEEVEPAYRMNAGDQIAIRVYDHEDLGMETSVGPDGMVGIAFMGQVKLSGLTIAEGAERIRAGIAPYVKNPVVSITVKSVQSENATIAGACAKPGIYGISNQTRLADLYAMAGSSAKRLVKGTDTDVADLEHSMVVRGGEVLPVDFARAINQGDPLNNIRLRRGDYVFIAQSMESSVTVCGEVRVPQKRLYERGMGLLETLTESGWMLDTHWKNVIVIRNGLSNPKMYKVDVDGILAGRRRNVLLKAGDIVYVPKDNMAEYNVFVKKLLPTAQIINLVSGRITSHTLYDGL